MSKSVDREGVARRRSDLSSSDALPSKIRERASDRTEQILDCLGQEARLDQDRVIEQVVLAALRYHDFLKLYENAPRRSVLHRQLRTLQESLKMARELLDNGGTALFASLLLGRLSESEVRALDSGSGSELQAQLREAQDATDAALARVRLTGAASGHKALALGPKQALVLYCAAIFERYRPGEIREPKHRGGEFPVFVRVVYQIATGDLQARLRRAIREARAAVANGRVRQPTDAALAEPFDPLGEFQEHLCRV
jgi:hypothetical protein